MNFRDFVVLAEEHLQQKRWVKQGHNGTWPQYRKPGSIAILPLPAALMAELSQDSVFAPVVEEYLTSNNWIRLHSAVSSSWPVFHLRLGSIPDKGLLPALLEQLKIHRIGNPTPTRAAGMADTVPA